jgi:ferredoxin
MARVISERTGESIEVPDGSPIKEAGEKLGVPFSCKEGLCGTCITEIVEGGDNLHPINENEDNLGADEKNRLICQCKIKSGDVKIRT